MQTPSSCGPDNATLLMLRDPAIAVMLPVVYSLVAAVSIPGNLFALWVLCCRIGPTSPSVIFMINLSVTDLMLACVLPFEIHYHCNGHHWVFGVALCTAVTVAFYANMYSSMLTMTCIAVERFLGVVHPLASAPWRRRRYALGACAACWLLLLAALSPLARADLTYPVEALGIVTCFDVLKWNMLPSLLTWAVFLFTLFVVLFLVPFVVTVACYTATIVRLLRSREPHSRAQRRRSLESRGPGSPRPRKPPASGETAPGGRLQPEQTRVKSLKPRTQLPVPGVRRRGGRKPRASARPRPRQTLRDPGGCGPPHRLPGRAPRLRRRLLRSRKPRGS
ncbi:PREDICTED: P2Y purinoceptor 8 [Condylura cristata]|uniref:P2Y purinoceptor 8 n=1 Tax=Condylura cristata TaxID=143302 RepID=UPI0006435FEB|nr:PREDICTED: P2Y purinoceptor 8 [Condylura cristata]